MRKEDIRSSMIWLVFSIVLCAESYRLRIGTLHNPGPGLYPLGIGLVIVVLSLIVLLSSILMQKEDGLVEEAQEKVNKKSIASIVICLFLYAVSLEQIGFIFSTLLFIILVLKIIERKGWPVTLSFGVFSTAMIYVVFNLLLGSRLPRGILGF